VTTWLNDLLPTLVKLKGPLIFQVYHVIMKTRSKDLLTFCEYFVSLAFNLRNRVTDTLESSSILIY
jgi:hypothetical protein